MILYVVVDGSQGRVSMIDIDLVVSASGNH